MSNSKIHFYRSTDFISLTEAWVKNYRAHIKEDPLAIETVIVHSQAIARYLNQALTQDLGVTANIKYLLPQTWENQIREIFLSTAINNKENRVLYNDNPYDPQYLRWVIYNILTHPYYLSSLKKFPILKNYLFTKNTKEKADTQGEGAYNLKAYQLSEIMAKLFNEYLLFREDMLWEWDNQTSPLPQANTNNTLSSQFNSQHWQKWMWQTIRQHLTHPHRLEELAQIKEAIRNNPETTSLPTRISVFGISYLPDYYLELFNNLKKIITINYYFPDTTRPWSYSVEKVKRPAFFEKLSELSDACLESIEKMNWEEIPLPPKNLPVKSGGFLPFIRSFFSKSMLPDSSQNNVDLQIHRCPNRRREVEVVKNQILNLLENNDSDQNITLDKILILAPDILIYQDYLESVFSCEPTLPFSIIDRNENHTNVIIQALFTLLDLFDSEWDLTRVRRILTLEVVQLAQGWKAEDLTYLEGWIDRLGVFRGRGRVNPKDTTHKKNSHGETSSLPHQDLNKFGWQEGIRRAMFHLAMPSEKGINEADLHGDRSQTLGKMIYLLQKLLIHNREFYKPAYFTDWLERLHSLVALLYPQDRQYLFPANIQKNYTRFNQQIRKLGERFTDASNFLKLEPPNNSNESQEENNLGKMNLHTFTKILKKNLGETEHSRGDSHHGITCGSLLPLRIIPSTATFIMGMARDEFPRHDHQKHFNLILDNPRAGDRTQKKGDYLLMIETLFATRNHLGITFCSGPDSNVTSPSVLVDELFSLIKNSSGIDFREKTINHPLLPYLDNDNDNESMENNSPPAVAPPRYSYDPEDYKNAIARKKQKELPPNQTYPLATTLTQLKPINFMLQTLNSLIDLSDQSNQSNPELKDFSTYLEQTIRNLADEEKKTEIVIRWKDISSFFIDAPKFFLKDRLGINLDISIGKEDEEEPFTLEGLNKYSIISSLVKEQVSKSKMLDQQDIIPQSAITENPLYPPGTPGNNQRELLNRPLHRLRENFLEVMKVIGYSPKKFLSQKPLIIEFPLSSSEQSPVIDSFLKKHPLKIEAVIDDCQIIGDTLHHILYRNIKINAHDIFREWLNHLLLHTTGAKTVTWLVGEEIFFFPPLNSTAQTRILPYILAFAAGHSQALPIYRGLSNIFHDEKMKAIKTIEKSNFLKSDQSISDNADKKVSFKENQLIPKLHYPYAHYLWGDKDESLKEDLSESPTSGGSGDRDENPSHNIDAFSDIYHHLWDELYHFLTRLDHDII